MVRGPDGASVEGFAGKAFTDIGRECITRRAYEWALGRHEFE